VVSFSSIRLTFIFLFLGIGCGVSAQLHGLVVDAQTQLPLSHVHVEVHELNADVVTDGKGYFIVEDIPVGKYHLHVLKENYAAKLFDFSVERDSITTLRIELEPSNFQLTEVVIEDGTSKVEVRRSSQAMVSISASELALANGLTLSEKLKLQPGISSISTGSGMSKPQIRAYSGARCFIQDLGMKHEAQQWGSDHGLEIDPFQIENIEWKKGAGNVLYGSDAIGGVLSIRLPDVPKEGVHGNVGSLYHTNNGAFGNSAQLTFRKEKTYAKLRATQLAYGDMQLPADSFTYLRRIYPLAEGALQNTAGKDVHEQFVLGRLLPKGKIQLSQSLYTQRAGMFVGAVGVPTVGSVQSDGDARNVGYPNVSLRHYKTALHLSSNRKIGWFELNGGIQENRRQEFILPRREGFQPLPTDNVAHDLRLRSAQINSFLRRTSSNGTKMLFGLFSEVLQHTRGGYDFLLPNYFGNQNAIYVQQNAPLQHRKKETFRTLGLRFEQGTLRCESFRSPIYVAPDSIGSYYVRSNDVKRYFSGLSLEWGEAIALRNKQSLKYSLQRAWRMPNAAELFINGVHHGTFRHEQGNAQLNPEVAYMLDLAYEFQAEKMSVSIAGYAHYFSNYIFLRATSRFSELADGGLIYAYSEDRAVFSGGEVKSELKLSNRTNVIWTAQSVFSYLFSSGTSSPFTPPVSSSMNLQHKLFDRKNKFVVQLEVQGNWAAAQNRVDRNEKTTPGYETLDMRIAVEWKWRKMILESNAGVSNVFNSTYYNHTSNYRRLNLPEMGRNVFFQTFIKF
jgi:iron complex outermembrane receptor protein